MSLVSPSDKEVNRMRVKMIKPVPDDTVLVSACLVGINCKYDGRNNRNGLISQLIENGYFIPVPVCPEQIGGLPTPRHQSEIQNYEDDHSTLKVKNIKGEFIEQFFFRGADEVLKIARSCNARRCIMKENSPSCGVKRVYDGSFSGKKIDGTGITSYVLKRDGRTIISSDEFVMKKTLVIGLFERTIDGSVPDIDEEINEKGGFIIE
jgi:uncharacterized protein YbbK (DUF523 family)